MEIGDVVRLKQPFQPDLAGSKTYEFAIIAGFVQDDTPPRSQPGAVLVYLYEPDRMTVYVDEVGSQSLFYFERNELIEVASN